MAFFSRFSNNPYLTGYIIRQFINCGKRNCHCYKDGKKHEVFRLKYREYDFAKVRPVKQKIKHIRRTDIASIQFKLSAHKGWFILYSYGDWAIFDIARIYPNLADEAIQAKAYETYGHSKLAHSWLNGI